MIPVQKDETITQAVQPLHQFIQDYNGNEFLLMLFACKKSNTTFCHFNGTEKKIEIMTQPNQFSINGTIFSYDNGYGLVGA